MKQSEKLLCGFANIPLLLNFNAQQVEESLIPQARAGRGTAILQARTQRMKRRAKQQD